MPLIHEALAGVMADIKAISKSKTNQAQGFKFRGIEDVYNALQPVLAKHKIVVVPSLVSMESSMQTTARGGQMEYVKLQIEYHFTASDGSSVVARVVGAGTDSGDKALGKAMSYAHKYALLQTFCIPTEDVTDGDEETHQFVAKPVTVSRVEAYTGTPQQKNYLKSAFSAAGIKDTDTMKRIADRMANLPLSALAGIIKEEQHV